MMEAQSEPACWSWDLPPLPQRNFVSALQRWQAGRCAVCGRASPVLHEDHDHVSGDTRGLLCRSCNVREARSSAAVFARYRLRPPTAILGLLLRYQCGQHPDEREVMVAWERALSGLRESIAPTSPLVEAIRRVGLTWDEWHGIEPDIPLRARYRRGQAPTGDRWAAMFRAELAEWIQDRALSPAAVSGPIEP